MTGLTLPASTAAALPGKVAAPSLLAIGAPADGAPGVASLAAFVDLMTGKNQVTEKQGEGGGDRQDDAAPGNALPDKAQEKTGDQGDPALAWLLSLAPLAVPAVDATKIAAAAGKPASAAAVVAPGDGMIPALADRVPPPPASPAVDAPQTEGATLASQTADQAPAAPATGVAAEAPTPAPAPAPAVIDAVAVATAAVPPAPITDAPAPIRIDVAAMAMPAVRTSPSTDIQAATPTDRTIPSSSTIQPIRIAPPATVSAAMAAAAPSGAPMPALFALAMAPERGAAVDPVSDKDDPASGMTLAATNLLSPAEAAVLVAQPGEAQRQALDMSRRDWPQKMIDRIEALRDDANANDTSIRLKPEALGRIDVSLRTHDDGAVSVHFAAEQPATRTLIADAAPQLNAAAEARGIRLAGTSVDLSGSDTTGGDRPRPQFEAQPPGRANHLSAIGGEDVQAVADGRIA